MSSNPRFVATDPFEGESPSGEGMLAGALDLEELGLALLPIEPGTKRPCMELLPRIGGRPSTKPLIDSPASRDEIGGWFRGGREPSIGVFTGAASNDLAIVDIDRPGRVMQHPPTPCVKTRRGWHLWFRGDAAVRRATRDWGEVRTAGDYVLAPPSPGYQWGIKAGEHPLARFDQAAFYAEAGLADPEEAAPTTAREPRYDISGFPSDPMAIGRHPSSVEAVMRLLGIEAQIGQPFCCVLPGHEESNPSAAVVYDEVTESFRYHDFHGPKRRSPEWLSLAEVYAAQKGWQRPKRLSGVQAATWWGRLAHDAQLFPINPVALPELPPDAPPAPRRLADSFGLLLGLRASCFGDLEPAPFSWGFASAWSGVSRRHVGPALHYLQKHEVLHRAGCRNRTNLYGPGPGR